MNSFRLAWVLVFAALGCRTEPLSASTGDMRTSSSVPTVHRPSATACPSDRPAGRCGLPATVNAPCHGDGDCHDGQNGRCDGNGHDGCSCSYDTCTVDATCNAGEVCSCRGAWHYGANGPNQCLPGNCRVDADCGANGYCSPSLDPSCGAFLGVVGWFCHTAQDGCTNDDDCKNLDGGYGVPFCGYHPEVGRWMCGVGQCVG